MSFGVRGCRRVSGLRGTIVKTTKHGGDSGVWCNGEQGKYLPRADSAARDRNCEPETSSPILSSGHHDDDLAIVQVRVS
eukprot:1416742-Rhodomonas_salina.1